MSRPSAVSAFLKPFTNMRAGTVAITVLCVAVCNAFVAWVIWQARGTALAAGRQNAERLVQLLEDHSRSAFQSADLVLLGLKAALEHPAPPAKNDAALREGLRRRVDELPQVRAIFVIDPDGWIIHDTDYPSTPAANLSDRSYFAVHREGSPDAIYVGRVIKSRSVEGWFVPVSRKVERNGVFAGVVVAALEPKFFEQAYQDLKLGPRDSVSLFNVDPSLIARFPRAAEQVGQPHGHLKIFQEPTAWERRGTIEGTSLSHGPAIVSFSRLSTFPLVTAVVLNKADLLAGWRRSTLAWTIAAAGCSFLLIALGLMLDQLAREREAAAKRALRSQKLGALGQMTSGIAHDFNNVLSIASASFRLIRKKGLDESVISAGEEAIERGSRLTTQLLRFAKHQELSPSLESINALVRALDPVIQQAAGPHATVSYRLQEGVLSCLVDRAQFDAAIVNLVVNASQAMESGEITISTYQQAFSRGNDRNLRAGQYVALAVADTGRGIAPEDIGRVFEPFFTTKKDLGTGLGLAQVYSFMHYIGGDASIQSEVGRGTTVELLFPTHASARHALI